MVFALSVAAFAKEKNSADAQVVELKVTEKGFEPDSIHVKANQPLVLKITRTTEIGCIEKIQIPSHKVMQALPLNKTVVIKLDHLKKGETPFGCQMDMMDSGKLIAE